MIFCVLQPKSPHHVLIVLVNESKKTAFIDIEVLAANAEFLMHDTAKNITPQSITLDGGWTAR